MKQDQGETDIPLPEMSDPLPSSRLAPTRWHLWLGGIALLGMAIRIGSVLGRPNRTPGADGFYYYHAALLLVQGKGFINPFYYLGQYHQPLHTTVQTASWPPLFVLIMAVPAVLGLKSYLIARLWLCLIGALAIVAVGYVGKEISNQRVGLIAAFLLAIYPNIWMSTEIGLSETITPLLVALILLSAYRFWKKPELRYAIWAGAALGISMLGRDELALLAVLIFLPLCLIAKPLALLKRLGLLFAIAGTSLVIISPWVGYNLVRFHDPVFISSGLGVTLASTTCDTTYSGEFVGYWSFKCALQAPHDTSVDETVNGSHDQAYAWSYISSHLSELPLVELDRLGRTFGFFRPFQQIQLDSVIETRPFGWARVGLVGYYALLALAIGGTVVLRKRNVLTFPLWAVGLDVVISTMLTFGDTRFRTSFEVSLVLLAAVSIDWFVAMRRHEEQASLDSRSDGPKVMESHETLAQVPNAQMDPGNVGS